MTAEAGNEPAASAPKKTDWSKLVAFVAIGGAIGYAYDNWDVVSTQYLGLPYTCENMVTELTAIPPANGLAPRLVGVVDRVVVSTAPERVECSGVGMFSNGMKSPITYRVYKEGGQWWMQYNG